jgi:hypothetical protein
MNYIDQNDRMRTIAMEDDEEARLPGGLIFKVDGRGVVVEPSGGQAAAKPRRIGSALSLAPTTKFHFDRPQARVLGPR